MSILDLQVQPPRFYNTATDNNESEAGRTLCISIALSAGIILTTIHMQDYKDVRGDFVAGRVTLPIAYPTLSRVSTALLLITWSWGVSQTWRLDDAAAAGVGVLALVVGVRLVVLTNVHADKVSFYWYNVSCPHHPIPTCLIDIIRHGFVWPICSLYIIDCD